MSTEILHPSRNRNRVYLLLLIALCIVPIVVAWLMVGRWQPGGTVNHGELLNPARPVTQFQLGQMDGGALDVDYLRGRWTLAYLGAGCAHSCQNALYIMRQVHLALGKDAPRAQTLLMLAEAPDQELRQWLQQEHKAMTVGVSDATTHNFFLHAFPEVAIEGDWIYLLDPLGNLLMRYRTELQNPVDSKGILDDLKRLFKYSKIG